MESDRDGAKNAKSAFFLKNCQPGVSLQSICRQWLIISKNCHSVCAIEFGQSLQLVRDHFLNPTPRRVHGAQLHARYLNHFLAPPSFKNHQTKCFPCVLLNPGSHAGQRLFKKLLFKEPVKFLFERNPGLHRISQMLDHLRAIASLRAPPRRTSTSMRSPAATPENFPSHAAETTEFGQSR